METDRLPHLPPRHTPLSVCSSAAPRNREINTHQPERQRDRETEIRLGEDGEIRMEQADGGGDAVR